MKTSEGLADLAAALSKAQGELKHPAKKKTAKVGTFSYRYADLADCIDVWRPVLEKHGLSLLQPTTNVPGAVVITTRLMHSSGQWVEDDGLTMPVGDNKPQTIGSAITYGRRYGGSAMVGISPDDDDDGGTAQEAATPATRTRTRAVPNNAAVLQPIIAATSNGYDTNDPEMHRKLHAMLVDKNVPEKYWAAVDNAMAGLTHEHVNRVIAEECGKL